MGDDPRKNPLVRVDLDDGAYVVLAERWADGTMDIQAGDGYEDVTLSLTARQRDAVIRLLMGLSVDGD